MSLRVGVNIRARTRGSPSLARLRNQLVRLRKAAGHEEAAAERFVDDYLERRCRDTFERHFMEHYIRRQDGALRAIESFRERVAELYAEAGVKHPERAELDRLYTDLSAELGKLESIDAFIERVPIKLAEQPAAGPVEPLTPRGALERVFGRDVDAALGTLPATTRDLFRRAAKAEPDLLSRAVDEAEASHQTRAIGDPAAPRAKRAALRAWLEQIHGVSERDAAALMEAIEDIGRRRHEEAAAKMRATERIAFDDIVERISDPAFERAARRTDGQPYRLVEIMARQTPSTLVELWRVYKSGGSKQPFHRYLEMIARSHFVGAAGEWHAAWIFGGEYHILKGPDANVTIPGTDLVLIHKATGKIHPVDNKAWRSALVDSVPALFENLPKNLVDDVAAARRAEIGGDPGLPAAVRDAPRKMATANREIAALLREAFPGEKPALDSPAVKEWLKKPENNAKIQDILNRNDIAPRVTGVGGEVEGVVQTLKDRGIDYLDEPSSGRSGTSGGAGGAGKP